MKKAYKVHFSEYTAQYPQHIYPKYVKCIKLHVKIKLIIFLQA